MTLFKYSILSKLKGFFSLLILNKIEEKSFSFLVVDIKLFIFDLLKSCSEVGTFVWEVLVLHILSSFSSESIMSSLFFFLLNFFRKFFLLLIVTHIFFDY